MASRFLSRYAQRLARCSQAPRAVCRLQCVTAPEYPPCTPSSVFPSQRCLSLGPGPAHEDDPSFTFTRNELYLLVEKATTPKEVLDLWPRQGGTPNQASMCLIQLSRLVAKGETDRAAMLKDPQCVDMLETVNSQVTGIWNGTLVSLLRALSTLGLSPSAPLTLSLQTEALWRLRRFTYRHLCYLADWALGFHSQKEGDETLLSAVLKQLELRWTELDDPRAFAILMSRATLLSPVLKEKLEDKALELVEKFSAEDIRRVSLALALQGRRAVPLLRALAYHLHQKPSSELNTALLLDIIFAYGKLHFHQTQVFQRTAAELLPKLPEMSSTEVMRCSKSLAFLKWLHLPLFEGFAQHFLMNSGNYNTLQMCNLLMAIAKLNFQPSNKDEFFKQVHEALDGCWRSLEPFLLTDVVWSLCVFQQAKPEYITALIDPAFQSKLTGGDARVQNYTLKLLHIAASGHLESGILSKMSPVLPSPASKPTQTPFKSSLHKALQILTEGSPKSLRTDVNTIYGWTIDAEMVINSDNKPISLENLDAPHLSKQGGTERIPQGAHRMAFLAWEYSHFCSKSKDLLGRFAMQKRHLQLAGFLVVEVPYFEWQELKSDWQKVACLKDKMGKAVAEDMVK